MRYCSNQLFISEWRAYYAAFHNPDDLQHITVGPKGGTHSIGGFCVLGVCKNWRWPTDSSKDEFLVKANLRMLLYEKERSRRKAEKKVPYIGNRLSQDGEVSWGCTKGSFLTFYSLVMLQPEVLKMGLLDSSLTPIKAQGQIFGDENLFFSICQSRETNIMMKKSRRISLNHMCHP